MTPVRYDPERELMSLREVMNRLFEESFVFPSIVSNVRLPTRAFGVAVDMYETDDSLIVKASVPGVKPEDLAITVQGEVLTITGEIKEEKQEEKKDRYHYLERRQGACSRTLTLPFPIQIEKAEAVFENGVLTLTLPKAEEIKPKTIRIREKVHA